MHVTVLKVYSTKVISKTSQKTFKTLVISFLSYVQQTIPSKMKECSSTFVLFFKIIFSVMETCLQMILLDLQALINTHMVSYCLKAGMEICLSWSNIY